jgi:hypothetical protein
MKLPLIAAIIFVALYSLLATAWISYTHLVANTRSERRYPGFSYEQSGRPAPGKIVERQHRRQ